MEKKNTAVSGNSLWLESKQGMSMDEAKKLQERIQNMTPSEITRISGMQTSAEIEMLDKQTNEALWSRISKSFPGSHFCLRDEDAIALRKLWNPGGQAMAVPSKPFFHGTIMPNDCMISVKEMNPEAGRIIDCNFRIVIYEDYVEEVQRSDGKKGVEVGAVITEVPQGSLFVPLYVCRGMGSIMFARQTGYHSMTENTASYICRTVTQNVLMDNITASVEIWYGIQAALRHPKAKDIFRNPENETVIDWNENGTGKKGTARSVKKYVIKKEDIDKAFYGKELL